MKPTQRFFGGNTKRRTLPMRACTVLLPTTRTPVSSCVGDEFASLGYGLLLHSTTCAFAADGTATPSAVALSGLVIRKRGEGRGLRPRQPGTRCS